MNMNKQALIRNGEEFVSDIEVMLHFANRYALNPSSANRYVIKGKYIDRNGKRFKGAFLEFVLNVVTSKNDPTQNIFALNTHVYYAKKNKGMILVDVVVSLVNDQAIDATMRKVTGVPGKMPSTSQMFTLNVPEGYEKLCQTSVH